MFRSLRYILLLAIVSEDKHLKLHDLDCTKFANISFRFFMRSPLAILSIYLIELRCCFAYVQKIVSLARGIRPIRTVQVSLDGKLYDVHDVTTVSELKERLQEVSGMTNETLWDGSQISFRGKTLKATDILRRVGVKDGAKVVVTLPESKSEPKLSHKKRKRDHNSKNPNKGNTGWGESFRSPPFSDNRFEGSGGKPPPSIFEWMKDEGVNWGDVLERLRSIKREDVSSVVRESLTRGYHQLRDFWNDPNTRNLLKDPIRSEAARQMILANPELRASIEGVPGGKKILNDQLAWQQYCQSLSDVTISAGDAILDGLLDVLIGILKSSTSSTGNNEFGTSQQDPSFQSETIDPSVASNVLFELSESEDEDY